jgi:hypothetical protein
VCVRVRACMRVCVCVHLLVQIINNLYLVLMSPDKEISASILKEPDFNILMLSAPFELTECAVQISHLCVRSVV